MPRISAQNFVQKARCVSCEMGRFFAFLAGGLFQEPFFDIVEDALRREHHGVEGDGKRDIFRALPDGGLGWEDDEVHGRAV